jgi:hypothetical protein
LSRQPKASNVKIGKMLGVSERQIRRDAAPGKSENCPPADTFRRVCKRCGKRVRPSPSMLKQMAAKQD